MYYDKCCVPGCNSLRQDVILHKFPSCEKRLKKWLDLINCSSLKTMSALDIGKLLVCHKHFEPRFVTKKGRLLGSAYPTLISSEETSSGMPLMPLEETGNVNPNMEHNYSKKEHVDHTYANVGVQPRSSDQSGSHVLAGPMPSTSKMIEPINTVIGEMSSISMPVESSIENIQHCSAVLNKTFVSVRKIRKRLMPKIGSLTPNCKRLYREYRKSRKELSFHCRAKKALKFSRENSFEKMTTAMNPIAKQIMWMQVKLHTKEKKGRRFTLEEKLVALAIMKQGPKCYKFLQRIFILPSATTLKNLIKKLSIQPGVNPQIFECIKKEVSSWTVEKKYCSLIFDEMSIEPGLTFNTHQDSINGFVHLTQRAPDFADHALVFMVKGAVHKWQQVIAYYFCEGSTKGPELKNILQSVIKAVGETGLVPIALISDQGSSFQSALKSLQQDTRREQILSDNHTDETIKIENFSMSIIYDPPHLIKGIRNNFLTKDISYNGKRAKWSDIVDVYKTDCEHAEARLLHKLNDEHVLPEKIKKMKVKNCVRVFSNTMAGALLYTSSFAQYVDGRPVSDTLKNTAEVVSFLDSLFDSVNGVCIFNKKNRGKLLRTAVTSKSTHEEFWRGAILKLEKLKFIDAHNHETVVPSIKNWITTLRSFVRLWQFFKDKNLKIMRPRFFNSDGIENFFGQVRSYNYRSNNPDCHSFTNTIKSLIITGFIKFHHNTFNCEDDSSHQIIKIKSLFDESESSNDTTNKNTELLQVEESSTVEHNIVGEARRERLNMQSRAYTAGWVVRKVLKTVKNCKDCKTGLTVDQASELHKWVSQREYNLVKKMKLTYASEQAIMLFGEIFKSTNTFLQSNAHIDCVSQQTKSSILHSIKFDFINCEEHKDAVIHAFIQFTIKLCIFNWCNTINKVLKGTDVMRLSTRKNLPIMLSKAYNKYKKKLKRK